MSTEHFSITSESYVILWSPHRKQFHIETVDDRLRRNRRIFKLGKPEGDFIALDYANSYAEALEKQKVFEIQRTTNFSDQTG